MSSTDFASLGMAPALAGAVTKAINAAATSPVIPAPTTVTRGGVLRQPAIANVAAAPTQADFNGLLAALRAAGVLST